MQRARGNAPNIATNHVLLPKAAHVSRHVGLASSMCVGTQCIWPLDVVEDVDTLCLPADDQRVLRRGTCRVPADPSIPDEPRPVQRAASEMDELQQFSNALFRPSPACSPAICGVSGHQMRLPTGDSVPSSNILAPSQADHELPMMASFELPPVISREAALLEACRHVVAGQGNGQGPEDQQR